MDIRIKVNTSRTMRLFNTESINSVSGQFTGFGKRVGFEISSLSRIKLMRKAWIDMAQAIESLELVPPHPRFPRQSSYEQVRSKDWIYHEELGKLFEGFILVSDDTYVSVEDHTRRGLWLSVMIDRNDFEDVRITTYKSFKLDVGEVIQDGDLRLKQPIHHEPILREREPVPPEWIGKQYKEEVHGSLKRQPKPTVLPLAEVIC